MKYDILVILPENMFPFLKIVDKLFVDHASNGPFFIAWFPISVVLIF